MVHLCLQGSPLQPHLTVPLTSEPKQPISWDTQGIQNQGIHYQMGIHCPLLHWFVASNLWFCVCEKLSAKCHKLLLKYLWTQKCDDKVSDAVIIMANTRYATFSAQLTKCHWSFCSEIIHPSRRSCHLAGLSHKFAREFESSCLDLRKQPPPKS